MQKVNFSMKRLILLMSMSALMFAWYPKQRWTKARAIAVLRSIEQAPKAVFFVRVNWAMQGDQLAKFLELERQVRRLPGGRRLRMEIVDVTDVRNSELPIVNWRGYVFSEHKVQGCGEVYWVEKGRIVNMVTMAGIDSVDDALTFTQEWLSD